MTTVTQWFEPEVKPAHAGAYESTPCSDGKYADQRAQWDGNHWRWVSSGMLCAIQRRKWRGLAEKPQP